MIFFQALFGQVQPFLPLKCRINLKLGQLRLGCRHPEQDGFGIGHVARRGSGPGQNLPKILVDGFIVINHKNAVIIIRIDAHKFVQPRLSRKAASDRRRAAGIASASGTPDSLPLSSDQEG